MTAEGDGNVNTAELAERQALAFERLGGSVTNLLHLAGDALELARDNRELLTRIDGRLAGLQKAVEAAAASAARDLTDHVSLAHRLERVEDYARTAADWPKWIAVIAALVGAAVGVAVKVL